MATRRGDVTFTAPHYNPEFESIEVIPENDITEYRRSSDSSIEPLSSDDRSRPSLAAKEERRRSSEANKGRRPSSFQSTTSGAIPNNTDSRSTRQSYDSSETFYQTKKSRKSVETRNALTDFAPIAAEYMKKEEERKARLEKHGQPDPSLDEELKCLHDRYSSSHSWIRQIFPFRYSLWPEYKADDLKRLAKFHFPPRSDVKIYVTDFKESSADTREYRLSDITRHVESKPNDVHVRWIHAPLGLGPLHSTIEDIFRHGGPDPRPFHHPGGLAFPYVSVEVLNLIDRSRFQKMRDVYHFLHDEDTLTEQLNEDCWAGFKPCSQTKGLGVLDDLRWRTTHLGLAQDWQSLPDFWTAGCADVPWQLVEGGARPVYGPLDGLDATLWQSDKQALHSHRFFGSVQAVRDVFRCFHRGDGFLLTLSAMRGANYIDRNLQRHLDEPRDAIFDNDVASAIAFVRQHFQDSGTQDWHRVTVEWLVVHLMTEIGITPHVDRQGCNAPSLEKAYQEVLQQFRRRRDEHFNRKDRYEPAELIQDMLTCKDELRRILVMSKNREHVFETLKEDVERFEKEDIENGKLPEHESKESAVEKVQNALVRIQQHSQAYDLLFEDVCMTLDSVYDLRSIQQRQHGIVTDRQQGMLFLITIVSIIFVPFSSLTGYWGMNLTDIRSSDLDQRRFWRVCASVVISVALFGVLIALLRYLHDKAMSQRKEREKHERLITGPANRRLDKNPV